MKKKILGVVSGVVLFGLSVSVCLAATDTMTVTLAGSSSVNGTYVDNCLVHNSTPTYTNGSEFLYTFQNGFKVFNSVIQDSVTVDYYTSGSWDGIYSAQAGSLPVPLVVLNSGAGSDCGGSGTSSPSIVYYSSSTPVYYYDWLYVTTIQTFCLLLIAFGTLFSIFRKPTK